MPTIQQAREWYAEADPVHDFEHVMRVYRLSERIALEEGADLEIVHAAALLHDSKGATPDPKGGARKEHHITSAEFAGEILKAEGWPEERILLMPLARLVQYQHCVLRRNGVRAGWSCSAGGGAGLRDQLAALRKRCARPS